MVRNRLNKLVLITGVIIFSLIALNLASSEDEGIVSGSSGSSSNQPSPPFGLKQDGYHLPLDSVGTEFVLEGNPYWPDLKIVSSEIIHLVLEAITDTIISYHIEPVSTTTKTEAIITLSGLSPFGDNGTYPPIFRHQDGFMLERFTPDEQDKYTYTQDLSKPHHVYFLPHAGTIDIYGEGVLGDEGWTIGTWVTPTTLQLTEDVNESIYIQADNLTLDGEDPSTGINHIISGPGYAGIYLRNRTLVTITNCQISKFTFGIYVDSSNNISLLNNVLMSSYAGIKIWGANHVTIRDNTAESNDSGISMTFGSNNTIENNTLKSNRIGIEDWYGRSNSILNNSLSLHSGGIFLYTSREAKIKHNTLANNYHYGIWLRGASCYNSMENNFVTSNTWDGIWAVEHSDYNTFKNNTFFENNSGVVTNDCSNNKFCHNNFKNNYYQAAQVDGLNTWDNGPLSGGNYWSDYTGNDPDGDGIGNTPYYFYGGQDNYPFMSQDFWLTRPPEIIGTLKADLEELTLEVTTPITLSLTPYEYDKDDRGWADGQFLVWSIGGFPISYTATIDPLTDILTITPTALGKDTLTLILTDSSGLTATVTVTITIGVVDTTPPVVSNITIQPDPTNQDPTITATAVDVDAVSNIIAAEYYGSWEIPPEPSPGFAHQMYAVTGFDTPTETVQATIIIAGLSEGEHTVWVRAKDEAGNWTTPVPTQTFTIDRIPPTVTDITVTPDPVQVALAQGGLTISIVFNEPMDPNYLPTVTYDPEGIIGLQPCTLNGTWATATEYTVQNDNLIDKFTGDGPAQISITEAQDLAGNKVVTYTDTFLIDIADMQVDNVNAIPKTFNPNPPFGAGEVTTISYVLSEPGTAVTIEIGDFKAKPPIVVRILVDAKPRNIGLNSEIWDGRDGFGDVVGKDKYDIQITAVGSSPTDVGSGKSTIEVDPLLPVITDLSVIPYPFYPNGVMPEIAFSTSVVMNINAYIEHTEPDGTITPITDRDFPDTLPAYWDGTNTGDFGADPLPPHDPMLDGVYGYGIKQKPPEKANRKTGAIMLIRQHILQYASPIKIVPDVPEMELWYTGTTPPATITVEPVEYPPPDLARAIVTQAPANYVQSTIYDITTDVPTDFTPEPALLIIRYDPAIEGDVSVPLKLRYWNAGLGLWEEVVPQYIDTVNHLIIAEIATLSSFYAILSSVDTTPPVITITSPAPIEYTNLIDGQPNIIPITYIAEDPVIDGITSGITYTEVTLNGEVYTEATIDLSDLLGENTLTVKAVDGSGNVALETVRFTVVLPATVTLKPESLKVNPGVLTAFVKFPTGYDVASIIEATCDGAKYESMELNDYGMTMVIKFRRKAIETALAEKGETMDTEFKVRGTFKINQQTYTFKGTDAIKKILPESVPPKKE